MRSASLYCVAVLLVAATTTSAEPVRIPLPELLGHRSVDDLSLAFFSRPDPIAVLNRNIIPFGAISYRLEWSGTLKAGRVVGDGVLRAPIEQVLQGSFIPDLSGRGESFGRFPVTLVPSGPFEETWQLDRLPGGFINRGPIGEPSPPDVLSISFKLVPDYLLLGNSIPFITTPTHGEPGHANEGLILLEPIEADITSAAIVFEAIPEPSTIVFAAAGTFLFVCVLLRRRIIARQYAR
jgi:hypothetical protein